MRKEELRFYKFILISFLLLTACNKNEKNNNITTSAMDKVKESEWIELSGKRIFFGHQSVGKNIIDGMNDLMTESGTNSLKIIESRDKSVFQQPAFVHAYIGKNTDPKSKIDDFINLLNGGLADSVDIAVMKLCYIDINTHTNIEELFGYYKTSMDSLHQKHPGLKILHTTVPITTQPEGFKGIIRILLKMDDNLARNRYNELVRGQYNTDEIIDIARVESTYPDGTTNEYKNGPALVGNYSSDGGHLNESGRILVAREMINKLLIN